MRPTHALLRDAALRLAAAGVETPRLDARLLFAQALGVTREGLLLERELTEAEREAFDALLARRARHEPLAYIAGVKEFWSLDFDVGPGVLVPRPESETLIEEARKEFLDPRAPLAVLDLGTGSGCLIISALKEFPRATGLGLDSSPEALAWAARNRIRHGLEARCELRLGDWTDLRGSFDLILANPPYIREGDLAQLAPELGHEPRGALDGGEDGLDAYRALAPVVARALKPGGRALIEIGAGQGADMAGLFAPADLELRHIAPDLAGIWRCVVLEQAKKPLESRGAIR